MYLVKISGPFELYQVIVRSTKILNILLKDRKILIFKVIFLVLKISRIFLKKIFKSY